MAKKSSKKSVEKKQLKPTKNLFKLRGVIAHLGKDNAYRFGEGKEDSKYAGVSYRSLSFSVKTSEHNQIRVSMFDYEPEEVYLWNSDLKKEDSNYKGTKVEYEDWIENMDEYREDGYTIINPKVGYERDEDGKLISHGYPSYYASKLIHDQFKDGDSVAIEGEIRYSSYTNAQGKVVEQKNFTIKKMFLIDDIDLEDAEYEEISYYEQQMVYVGIDIQKKLKKAYLVGRTIDYKKNFKDVQFVIDFSGDDENGHDADMVQLVNSIQKKFKFGDVINVFGSAVNKAIVAEVPEEDKKKKADANLLGGKKKPQHAVKRDGYISEMQVEGIDAWDKGVYAETDFVVEEAVVKKDKKQAKEDKKNKLKDELGGKDKNPFKKDDDPFADDDEDEDEDDDPFADDDDDEDDENLPF